MALWREDGSRKAKTLGTVNGMTKADAQDELNKIVQP